MSIFKVIGLIIIIPHLIVVAILFFLMTIEPLLDLLPKKDINQ